MYSSQQCIFVLSLHHLLAGTMEAERFSSILPRRSSQMSGNSDVVMGPTHPYAYPTDSPHSRSSSYCF